MSKDKREHAEKMTKDLRESMSNHTFAVEITEGKSTDHLRMICEDMRQLAFKIDEAAWSIEKICTHNMAWAVIDLWQGFTLDIGGVSTSHADPEKIKDITIEAWSDSMESESWAVMGVRTFSLFDLLNAAHLKDKEMIIIALKRIVERLKLTLSVEDL